MVKYSRVRLPSGMGFAKGRFRVRLRSWYLGTPVSWGYDVGEMLD